MPTGQVKGSFADPQDLWTNYLHPRLAHIQSVSPRDRPDVIQIACQKIDDEVAIMLAAISSLRARRNALSYISSLPPEVLGRIFHFHATNEPPHRNGLGWIRATHVCRVWRETALQHPSLWSDVTDRLGHKWTKEMLTRTKSVPISYSEHSYIARNPPRNVMAGYVLQEHLSRIHHLSLAAPTKSMNAILESMIASPAPILESLNLEDASPFLEEEHVLLGDIFNRDAPMLCRLELHCIELSWSACFLRHLIHLHVDNQDDPRREPATDGDITVYSQFFCALREMSALETLFLSHCLPAEPRDPPGIQTVMLPRIKMLTLCGNFPVDCKNILKHLTMPSTCDVTVKSKKLGLFPFHDTFSFVKLHTLSAANELPSLTMFLSTAMLPVGRTSYLGAKWQLRFWAAGSDPDLADLRQDRQDIPSISILVDREQGDIYDIFNNVQALCQCPPHDVIRDLIIELDGVLALTPNDWLYVFGGYTEVENISVTGNIAQTLCGALGISESHLTYWQLAAGREGEDGSQLSREQLFLGKLKRIEFKQVDFHSNYERDVWVDDGNGGASHMISTNVHAMLKISLSRRRAASDAPLTLFLRRCPIDSDQIRELQEIVEVDWDHVENLRNEDDSDED